MLRVPGLSVEHCYLKQTAVTCVQAAVECHAPVFKNRELAEKTFEMLIKTGQAVSDAFVAVEVEGRTLEGVAEPEETDYDSEGNNMSLEALVCVDLLTEPISLVPNAMSSVVRFILQVVQTLTAFTFLFESDRFRALVKRHAQSLVKVVLRTLRLSHSAEERAKEDPNAFFAEGK